HRGARSPRWTHSAWFGCFPATMPLKPLPRPALWSVSRQSPNRSSISHTSGSGKRQRSPRGGQMVRMRTLSNHRVSRAELERELILARTSDGRARAKARGVKFAAQVPNSRPTQEVRDVLDKRAD